MSSYDEHLISQAGGDGDEVDAIQRRADKTAAHHATGNSYPRDADRDRDALLALVRSQQATLAAVLNLANTSGRCGWRISADELRKTLRGES